MVSRLFGKLEVNRQRIEGADCAIAGAASVVPAASTSPDLMTSRRFIIIPQRGLFRRSLYAKLLLQKAALQIPRQLGGTYCTSHSGDILGRGLTDEQSEVRGAAGNSWVAWHGVA